MQILIQIIQVVLDRFHIIFSNKRAQSLQVISVIVAKFSDITVHILHFLVMSVQQLLLIFKNIFFRKQNPNFTQKSHISPNKTQ